MLIDSHCHLDFDSFDEDRAETIARAQAAGIDRMVTICTRLSRFDEIHAIARAHACVDCSVGIHPHQVAEEGVAPTARLVELAAHPEVVGIGETGLDYYYDYSPRDEQRENFRNHIAAARQTGLPLIVHTRDADQDTMNILREETGKGPFPGVLHCFSSRRALAETALELGLYISFSGIATFKNAQEIRDIAADVPIDRILVETDAPFLAPVPNRGKRNEPAFVTHTAEVVAGIKGLDVESFARATTENFYRLFAKSQPAARPSTCPST